METPDQLQIDVTQMYQIIGMLTAENAALKLARANDAALIQQLMAAGPPPAESGQSYGTNVDTREPGVVEPEN